MEDLNDLWVIFDKGQYWPLPLDVDGWLGTEVVLDDGTKLLLVWVIFLLLILFGRDNSVTTPTFDENWALAAGARDRVLEATQSTDKFKSDELLLVPLVRILTVFPPMVFTCCDFCRCLQSESKNKTSELDGFQLVFQKGGPPPLVSSSFLSSLLICFVPNINPKPVPWPLRSPLGRYSPFAESTDLRCNEGELDEADGRSWRDCGSSMDCLRRFSSSVTGMAPLLCRFLYPLLPLLELFPLNLEVSAEALVFSTDPPDDDWSCWSAIDQSTHVTILPEIRKWKMLIFKIHLLFPDH